jgi:hypothetical protein
MSRFGIFLLLALAALAQASIPGAGDQAPVKQQKPGIVCKACDKVLMTLKKIVQNPALEQDLIKTLKGICDFPLFKPFQKKCIDKANTIVTVLEEIKGALDDPAGLCDMMKLCKPEAPSVSSVSKQVLLSFASKIVQDVHPINAIDTCGLCTSALDELKRILETPEILQKVQNGLESLCKYAGKYEKSCKEGIEIYLPNLVQMALDALCQPEQTCKAIKLCKASLAETLENLRLKNRLASLRHQPSFDHFLANISSIQTVRGINAGCFACKAAVGGALEALTRPKMLTMVTKDITDAVCKIMPSGLKAGCFDFLEIYGKAALQLTLNEWTPAEICTAVHACNAVFLQQIESLSIIEKSVAVCDACQLLSKFLAYELEQADFQQDVINVLTRGCLLLPGKYGNKCGDLVIQFVPFGLSYAADFLSRPDACSVVRLC